MNFKAISNFFIGFMLMACQAFSQSQASIKVISTDGVPLSGATVLLVDSALTETVGWLTDANGLAKPKINKRSKMRVSYVGFLSQELWLSPSEQLTVELEEDLMGLEEVVVTGAFVPTVAAKSLYNVKKLDQKVIEARGAVNLADLLQVELNTKIIQDDVLGSRIIIQGISGPNVKILMNGLPLVNGNGGEFDLGQINMNNVERIEVVEGPLSVQYGTNALAGTINVITKNASGQEGEHLGLNGYYESVGQYNIDAYAGKSWGKYSLNVSAGRNQFDGFSATGERSKNWNPKTQYLGDVTFTANFDKFKLGLFHNQLLQESIGYGNASTAFNPKSNKLSQIATDRYYTTVRSNTSLSVDVKLSTKDHLSLVNGYSRYKQGTEKYIQDVVDDFRWLSTNAADHDTTSFTSWTYRGTYIRNYESDEDVSWVLGYDVNLNSAAGGRVNEEESGKINDYALFTALYVPIGDKFTVQPAVRYVDNNTFDTSEIDFLGTELPLLPSLGVLYRPNARIELRASYGKGYRTPSVRELYYEFIDANHYIVGNTALKAEIGDNLNASFKWNGLLNNRSFVVSPSAFFNTIKNKIELVRIADRNTLPDDVPKTVPVARTYGNIPEFKSYGANLSAAYLTKKGLELRPGLGVLARSGSQAKDKFYFSYEANLNTSYLVKSLETRFSLFYKYNGEIAEFSLNEDGTVGTQTLGAYNTIDVSATRAFLKGKLLVTLGGKNLMDVTDVPLSGDGTKGLVLQTGREPFYPISWGATFFAKINYSF